MIAKTQNHTDIPLSSHQTQVKEKVIQEHMSKVKDCKNHFPLKKWTIINEDVKTDSTQKRM